MMGDGKTGYDHAKDGEANEVAACSVRTYLAYLTIPMLMDAGELPTTGYRYQSSTDLLQGSDAIGGWIRVAATDISSNCRTRK